MFASINNSIGLSLNKSKTKPNSGLTTSTIMRIVKETHNKKRKHKNNVKPIKDQNISPKRPQLKNKVNLFDSFGLINFNMNLIL